MEHTPQKRKAIAISKAEEDGMLSVEPEFQNDKEVVMAAIQQNGMAIQYFRAFQNDEEVVTAAVQQNGMALEYASQNLKNDKEVVTAAVQQNGMALYHASRNLKNDADVVKAAVQQNGMALQYAPNLIRLRGDPKIACAAVISDRRALRYVHDSLDDNDEFAQCMIDNKIPPTGRKRLGKFMTFKMHSRRRPAPPLPGDLNEKVFSYLEGGKRTRRRRRTRKI